MNRGRTTGVESGELIRVRTNAMRNRSRKEEYLAKAKEAEEEAAKAKTGDTRESWLKIAASYKELARGIQH